MTLPNVVICSRVRICGVGPYCGRGHSKGVDSRTVQPVVKGYVKGLGWLLSRVVGLIGVILIKWGIIRVRPVIVWVWFLIIVLWLLVVWFWIFRIGRMLFIIWGWLHIRIFILVWWRIGLFIVFRMRIVQGDLSLLPVQRFAGGEVMWLLWVDRFLIRIVVHLIEQLTLMPTIMTIQLLAVVPSVIQGSSKILGPVKKSSPAAEIMDVPVQRPDDVSQLWQKLFCVVREASRSRL